jgi:hypothetical protein
MTIAMKQPKLPPPISRTRPTAAPKKTPKMVVTVRPNEMPFLYQG